MPARVKIDANTWKDVIAIRVKTSATTWKDVIAARVKTAVDTWADWFGAKTEIATRVTISQSTNATTKLVTLTGTNYNWNPAPTSLSYQFIKAGHGAISSGTATNPASGSSNTYTTTISASANIIDPNASNEFTFLVTATYGGSDSSSESLSTTVYGPTDTTLSATVISDTRIDLSWTASSYANGYLIYINPNNSLFVLDSVATITSKSMTGLVPGASYSFYVVPITGTTSANPGYSGNNSNTVTTQTLNGGALVPTFGTNTSTSGGFTGSVTNYNTLWTTWNISASAGTVTWGTASGATRPFTVTGLGLDTSSIVTVTTKRSGYDDGTATTTGWSLAGSALVPTFGAITRTATGFDSSVTNYDATWTWSTPNSADGTLYETGTYVATGTFTWGTASGTTRPFSVTGNLAGTSVTAVISTSKSGYTGGSASVTGVALNSTARIPTFGPYTATATGFTGYVNNYDSNWTWTLNGIERGTFTWGTPSGTNYPFTVTGMTRGQSSLLGIRSSRPKYDDGVGTMTGYSLPIEYTITYQGNGNTGGSTASTTGAIPLTIASNGFTRTNYTFRSWNDSASGTGTVYNPGGTYNTAANLTLYAIWDIIQYTVTWNANGGSVSPASNAVNAGSSVTAPTPTRSGYTFNGWYNASSGGSLIVSGGGSYTPTASITLYAQWTIIPPGVSSITANGYNSTTAPYINFTFNTTNASSFSFQVYRSSTSSTGPWTALSARLNRDTTGSFSYDVTVRNGTVQNWYYVDIIPYSGPLVGGVPSGTAGSLVTSRVRYAGVTGVITVYP